MINEGINQPRSESVDVKEYLAVLLKRKWLVLICFLLSMAATTAFLFTRQPIYRAACRLLVTQSGTAVQPAEVVDEDRRSFYSTQVDIMMSQTMMRRVQQRLRKTAEEVRENLTNLQVVPVRGASIIRITVDSPSKEFAKDFANALAEEYLRFRDEQRAQNQESALLLLTREVNRLSQELKAAQERYVAYAKEHDLTQMQGGNAAWWNTLSANFSQLGNLKQALARAQGLADALEKSSPTAAIPLLNQQQPVESHPPVAAPFPPPDNTAGLSLTPPGSLPPAPQLVAVPPDTPLTGDPLAIPPTASSTTIPSPDLSLRPDTSASTLATIVAAVPDPSLVKNLIALDEKRATLEKRISDLSQFYKPMHPAMMAAQQELDEVNRKINFNMQFARELQRSHIASLQSQVVQAEAALKQAEAEGLERNRALVMSTVLQDDIQRIRSLHNALLNQLMKIDVSQGFSANNVSILEPALVEPEPVYPKKLKGLMVAAAFGLGVGLALAFFIEYIDDSIKLAEEVERDLQLPFLGMVPAAQWNPDDLAAHRLDRLKQQGGVAEAYRVVRSAIIVSMPREKLRTILVTSAVPREGKTTTTLNLAIGFSQIEDRVLLVDGDLRRGETHKYFNLPKEKGFADVLLGEATADEVVKQTDVPKLDVITCGSYPANPAELLLGWRLKEFLDWAKQRYSRVFIDCAPVMGIADGAILGSAVDGVLFIIWAGRTSRRYVRVAKTTASSRGAKIFGFMLNNLEPGRVGYYHYYPYYYSYYSRGYYYASKDEDAGKGGDVKGIPIPSSKDDKKANMDDVY